MTAKQTEKAKNKDVKIVLSISVLLENESTKDVISDYVFKTDS